MLTAEDIGRTSILFGSTIFYNNLRSRFGRPYKVTRTTEVPSCRTEETTGWP
jgi:hypothetical protein